MKPILPTRTGYTLIELLVVISIIGVLAGMILAVMPGTGNWRTRRAVETQMAQLITLIEAYKEARGYYPPSNPVSSATNFLFYELVGTEHNSEPPSMFSVSNAPMVEPVTPAQIQQVTGGKWNRIFNSWNTTASPRPELDPYDAYRPDSTPPSRSFHAEIKRREHKVTLGGIRLFTVAGQGTGPDAEFNPWNYVAPGRHNPNSFDLWATVVLGSKTNVLGNWKEGK